MATPTLAKYSLSEFAEDVRLGLTKDGQKEILSKYLYDEVGSALFEVITVLPEYGLFRADERLLRENARVDCCKPGMRGHCGCRTWQRHRKKDRLAARCSGKEAADRL